MIHYPLDKIRLKDGTLSERQKKLRDYIVNFDIDRLMHTFRQNAGIESTAEPLGGWEAPWCDLRGHFVGHFLSAAAKLAYGLGDEECEKKANTIVDIMAECQREDGYLSAYAENHIDRLETNEDHGIWAPYYTLHKILTGLITTAKYLGNEKAAKLAVDLSLYIYRRFSKLSEDKIDRILRPTRLNPQNEYGGIGDALYSVYEYSGDERILDLAKIFDRDYFIGELSRGNDVLTDLHANTHIPEVIAALHRYEITKEKEYLIGAKNYYSFVLSRTFANGNSSGRAEHFDPNGVSSKSEHWGGKKLDATYLTGGESESCCAHNTEYVLEYLLKYAEEDELTTYLSHMENLRYSAVYNCISDETGLSLYHQPMGECSHKNFSSEYGDFWCCTGSGVEAAAELQKNIWFSHNGMIFVNMFVSSTLSIDESTAFELKSSYPYENKAKITHKSICSKNYKLGLRKDAVSAVYVNGEKVALTENSGIVSFEKELSDGDEIMVDISSGIRESTLDGNDGDEAFALLYGNILLAKIKGEYRRGEELTPKRDEGFVGENCVFLPVYDVQNEEYTVYMNSSVSEKAKDGSSAYGN